MLCPLRAFPSRAANWLILSGGCLLCWLRSFFSFVSLSFSSVIVGVRTASCAHMRCLMSVSLSFPLSFNRHHVLAPGLKPRARRVRRSAA